MPLLWGKKKQTTKNRAFDRKFPYFPADTSEDDTDNDHDSPRKAPAFRAAQAPKKRPETYSMPKLCGDEDEEEEEDDDEEEEEEQGAKGQEEEEDEEESNTDEGGSGNDASATKFQRFSHESTAKDEVKTELPMGNYSSVSKKLMASMGFTPGSGLGKQGQGMRDIIPTSKQRGRRGLGLSMEGLEPRSDITWDFSDEKIDVVEPLDWIPECQEDPPTIKTLREWTLEGKVMTAPFVEPLALLLSLRNAS
ncbi:hypothetical protein HPB48_020617 [Haemaphysalis longicornis]|uniref:Cap-specific mRNA (nucleoside-2'-O-)-methyltransferase 1 n=1 Tax=Haemaphysalis longicornis TaxID=44386 RepID=A0A9J6GK40_HAELO|nr:hypothetical protein HPB48_020617 [Haemaphysalis longicornis]